MAAALPRGHRAQHVKSGVQVGDVSGSCSTSAIAPSSPTSQAAGATHGHSKARVCTDEGKALSLSGVEGHRGRSASRPRPIQVVPPTAPDAAMTGIPAPGNGTADFASAMWRKMLDLEAENKRLRQELETHKSLNTLPSRTEQSSAPVATPPLVHVAAAKPQAADVEHDEAVLVSKRRSGKATRRAVMGPDGEPTMSKRPSRHGKHLSLLSRFSWPPSNDSFCRTYSDQGQLESEGSGASLDTTISTSAMSTSAPADDADVCRAFTEFVVVGVRPAVLRGEELPLENDQQPLEVLERFLGGPNWEEGMEAEICGGLSGKNGSSIEQLCEFCFPSGGRLELAPADKLESLTGPHRDQTHVLQFTDALGATSYGVCLTVYEPYPEAPTSLVYALKKLRHQQQAAEHVQAFMRRFSEPDGEDDEDQGRGSPEGAGSLAGDSDDVGWVRKGLFDQVRNRMRKLGSGGWGTPTRAGSTNVQSCTPPPNLPRACSLGTASLSCSPEQPRVLHLQLPKAPPKLVKAESDVLDDYHRMIRSRQYKEQRHWSVEDEEEDDDEHLVVVAPRCFCLMSRTPNHPLLVKLLQLVVERERKAPRSLGAQLASMKRRHSCQGLSHAGSNASGGLGGRCKTPTLPEVPIPVTPPSSALATPGSTSKLDKFLASESSIPLPTARRRFLRHIQVDVEFPASSSLTVTCPQYAGASMRLDFPLVSLEHWTVAVLFSRLPAELIVKCVNLLLLEQSLIIVGDDLGAVSAVGTALIGLLAPFQWDGVFVPVLPMGLSEFLQSPVPFVVGLQPPFDHSRYPGAAVLSISAGAEYLNAPLLDAKLPICYHLLQELQSKAKIFSGRRSRWANLQLSTYMQSLTPHERNAVTSLRAVLQGYVERLSGDLKYPDAWRKYGAFNANTHDFEFHPAWFLGPLQMMLDFQARLVRTQMFVSYIDRRRAEDLWAAQQRLRCQSLIAHFIWFRLTLRKKRRQHLQQRMRTDPTTAANTYVLSHTYTASYTTTHSSSHISADPRAHMSGHVGGASRVDDSSVLGMRSASGAGSVLGSPVMVGVGGGESEKGEGRGWEALKVTQQRR